MRVEADLHEYQRTAVDFLLDNPRSALFCDVGLGKSVMTLTVLSRVLADLDSGQALVIAPIRVAKQTWPTELREWSHVDWIDHTLIRAEDSDDDVRACFDAYRMRYIEAATALDVPAGVRSRWAAKFAQGHRDAFKQEKRRRLANTPTPLHIIGLPQVEWLVQHHGKRWPYRTVVIDESSAFKDFSTKRWKAINSVYKYIDRMHILTASPAAESWLDVWAQIGLLDRGERLGRRITHYRDLYFKHDPYTYSYELLSGAQERISEKIGDICLVMKAEDHLDRSKPLMLTRPVVLNDHAIALYDDFVQNYILSLPEAEIEAVSGGVLINKLLQFTGGAVLDEDRNMHEVHNDKIDELRELIEELQGEPLMVAYWYKSSLARLKKAFPQATVMDKGARCTDDWNAGKIPLLLIHPACLHPWTEVLTEGRGWVRLVDVKPDERVHDGVEFVSHRGCSFSGIKPVIEVFGVVMTPEHKLLVNGRWVEARDVRDSGTTAEEARHTGRGFADCVASEMRDLRRRASHGEAKRDAGQFKPTKTLPGMLPSRRSSHDWNQIPFHMASDGFAREQSRRSGLHTIRRCRSRGVGRLAGFSELLPRYVRHVRQRLDDRSTGQRLRLFERELPLDQQHGSAVEQEQQSRGLVRGLVNALGRVLPGKWHGPRSSFGATEQGYDRRSSSGRLAVVQVPEEPQISAVYDLVDCGPRNRFLIRNAKGQVFVSHNSAGHGLNLQKGPGHDIAFFDVPWSRELYDQVIGRIDRQGQKKVVRVHHLLVQRADDGKKRSKREQEDRMTADEIVMAALADKGDGQAALFRFIKAMRARLAARAGSVVKRGDSDGDDL